MGKALRDVDRSRGARSRPCGKGTIGTKETLPIIEQLGTKLPQEILVQLMQGHSREGGLRRQRAHNVVGFAERYPLADKFLGKIGCKQ